MKNQKVLVTGGSGYFGSLLTEKLLSKGAEVINFDINTPDNNDARFIRGDIRSSTDVEAALKGVDCVFHNVAQVPVAKDIKSFWDVNHIGTNNLIRALKTNNVEKLIYTSSSAVFGVPATNPVTEATMPNPVEDYGRAKLAGERACLAIDCGMDVSVIRPRTILGHGRLGIFQILFEWVYQGSNIPVLGQGDNIYQFVHAEDLAEACILAAEKSKGTQVYNCGAERFGTMRETLEGLVKAADTGSQVKSVPEALATAGMKLTSTLGLSPLGPYHWMMYGKSLFFDISKSKIELGWQPKYSNIEMIVNSYEWYVKNRKSVLAGGNKSHHKSALKQGVLSLAKYFL